MSLPFSTAEFFAVLRHYNEAVWPMQIALNALGFAALMMVLVPVRHSGRLVSAALALLWSWTAVAYHLAHFSQINPAARLFALLFIAGALLFAWQGAIRGRLRFACDDGPRSTLGLALIGYAMLVYPFAAIVLGRGYPETPTFGVPCPTTIFTIGMLAFLRAPYPRMALAAPLAWAAIGSQAAVLFGVYEDLGLLAAGIAGAWLLLERSDQVRQV